MSEIIVYLALASAVAAVSPGTGTAVDRVATALAASQRAAARGEAARVLIAEGAQPLDGQADLAQRWAPKLAHLRDRALGPGYRLFSLARGEAAEFDQTFLAGERANVAVVPVAKSHFLITVRDDDGQSKCAPREKRCDWIPLWTARYHLKIVNDGDTIGQYFLVLK